MQTSTKAIETLRALRFDAKSLHSMERRYKEISAPQHVDKHAFRFSSTDRSTTFSVRVGLENYSGTYGNSSTSRIFSLRSADGEVQKHFLAALNIHREMILQTMAQLMDQAADKLKAEAEAEIAALRALIDTPLTSTEASEEAA